MDSKLETLKQITKFLKTGEGTAKIKNWVTRFKPVLQGAVLFVDNKPVIPKESVAATLKKVGARGMPIKNHKLAWEWVKARFVGIHQKDVSNFVNAFRRFEKLRLKKDQNINRYIIDDEMMSDIKDGLHGKVTDSRTAKFLRSFPALEMKRGKIFLQDKEVISTEELPKIMNDELVQGGCPMSCEAAYDYLRSKYCGSLTRRNVSDFIQSLESWQLNKTRPPNPDQIRATYKHQFTGTTRFLLSRQRGGDWNTLCSDLMYIPIQWGKYKFFLCVLHMRSNFCWFEPLVERKAKDLIAPFRKILRAAEKRFGPVKQLQTDGGVEYLSNFGEFLKTKKIKHINDYKSYHCERKIGQFGRSFGQLLGIGVKFEEALYLTLEKLNNTKSRATGLKPSEVQKHTKLKKPRKLKKGNRKHNPLLQFSEGDKVRFLKKNAETLNLFYKSYGSTSRKPKHENWSRTTPKIIQKKIVRGTSLYKLAGEKKWRKGWQLQKVYEVRQLELLKQPLKLPASDQKKIAAIKKKEPATRRTQQMKNLEEDLGDYWQPVRGKRKRKKVNYRT